MCEVEVFCVIYVVQGCELVYINLLDVKVKGIKDGDLVCVFNDCGQLLVGVVLSDSYLCGVICIEEGVWYGLLIEKVGVICIYGDFNILILDFGMLELV